MRLLDKLQEKVVWLETLFRTNIYKSLGGFGVGGGAVGYVLRWLTGG
jgi:hypothetical protein